MRISATECRFPLVGPITPISDGPIDLCVVRSHEYYSGVAFEVDVVADGMAFVEVGGGGRYDRLVGHFVPAGGRRSVPATGFAFGVERLVHLLESLHLLGPGRSTVTSIGLHPGSAEVLLVPAASTGGYLEAARAAAEHRAAGRAVDIYLGAPENWRDYALARGIRQTQPLLVVED
ncbi:Histidyl-tRNA synthetase [Streptoalloteichus tenebrarius]|uniref:Histidyl-tRNA synthetase n=1 Tax=Streptoalloteichus tenebrarius (strain ATCC 17920 / DSM 40477 / JCM 4838 / CBS 697.72 / NBRC 16177 / NCIMB 11028 / NRRL B-12390 / A12253. 1 / ISP 5477) TaxID=1933 RepID=A0ABT1HPN0_STRSD|nr:ATP phosphoribosyltransferase regulatory subunit [Streptoalloteichus tenebrarius]MCP2257472.1 Histidyl-tRNA synthetase [Streptoalloteichus tenebrarius]BFE98420.1 hypothetical protein GCM10020241_00960 [Streptoalloteichus tenebrarius]